ncbi:MAG: UDP-N-acetylmuramate:L-alanyl-gamma-D-glutamyl-meso-diaminopimelate ligase [Mariprofundales bacterium]|nr:UDP-N-acetylmuramate:L-alanyl-gamma-D-glutamyl-meso-diaminopimelate ligase [Mariprofundales bacterium]
MWFQLEWQWGGFDGILAAMNKHTLYIIGICGTAMAAIAALAKARGWEVCGSDAAIYPPMSDYLRAQKIPIFDGFDAARLHHQRPDLVVVGNAISRGNPELEAVLDAGWPYTSGAQFVGDHLLPGRHALVVAGTHGKTSTASLLAHLLEEAGKQPGFLIGGVAENFAGGARLGEGADFVLEGDEYDTALFDKRSKFLHYHARTLILNNLEFDHADIFDDLAAIQRQFHHLLRTIPSNGVVVLNADDAALAAVIAQGCWTPCIRFARYAPAPQTGAEAEWQWLPLADDGSAFRLYRDGAPWLEAEWGMIGLHQVANACAAVAACVSHGVKQADLVRGLASFAGVRRRMTLVGEAAGVQVYDDFAHHPTAIAGVVTAMRAKMDRSGNSGRVWVIIEPRSNTMRRQIHTTRLPSSLVAADRVIFARPCDARLNDEDLLDVDAICHAIGSHASAHIDASAIIAAISPELLAGDVVLILSNGGFDGIHQRLLQALSSRW